MLTYQDIHTGKTFTVANNQVTDAFGNVATIPATEWVQMQGGDIVLIEGAEAKHTSYSFTNEAGNTVDVTFAQRTAAHKTIAKAFGMTWAKVTKSMDMQSRVIRLGCFAKPSQFALYQF